MLLTTAPNIIVTNRNFEESARETRCKQASELGETEKKEKEKKEEGVEVEVEEAN